MYKRVSEISKNDVFNLFSYLLIFFCIYTLIVHYNTESTPNKIIQLKQISFSLLEPKTLTLYEVKDVYNKLFNLEFKFTINSMACKDVEELLVLIVVASNPSNYDKRNAVRKTYGKATNYMKIVFIMGITNDRKLSREIKSEALVYDDIIQGNFVDSYRNMTYKHVMGLKWSVYHCPGAKYVLKVDDDLVINTLELPKFLTRNLSPFGSRNLMLCRPYSNSLVMRNQVSKWYVAKEEFPDDFYPPYCYGPFILYSKDVVVNLLDASQKMPYLYIDDAFVTGIVARKIGVSPTDIGSLFLDKNIVELKKSTGTLPQFLMGPWELSADGMLKMWEAVV